MELLAPFIDFSDSELDHLTGLAITYAVIVKHHAGVLRGKRAGLHNLATEQTRNCAVIGKRFK